MKDAQPTEETLGPPAIEHPQTEDAPSQAQRTDVGRLYARAALILLAAGFVMAARSWALYGLQEGIPEGLFTQTDFPAVVIASRLAASGDGSRLYDLGAQLEEQHRLTREGFLRLRPNDPVLHYPYPYTPFLALLWAPFTDLDPPASMALYDLFNLFALVFGIWMLLKDLPLPALVRALLMLGVLTSRPWVENLEQGQSSGLIALGLALGVAFLRRDRDWAAGLALGLLFLKVQWLPVLVLVLLLKGRWRTLAGLVGVGVALSGIATLALGPEWIPAYLEVLTSASQSGTAFLLTPAASHSLNGGIYALLGPGGTPLVGPLNVVGTLLVIGLVLYLWARTRVWQPGTPAWDALIGLTVLAAIFTNPQLNTHDISLVIIPAALGFASMYGMWSNQVESNPAPGDGNQLRLIWHLCLWLLYFTPLLLLGILGNLLDAEHLPHIRLTTWLLALMLGLLARMAFSSIRNAGVVRASALTEGQG